MPTSTPAAPRYALGTAALMIGSAANYFGDRMLGAHIEIWSGLSYFGAATLADIFVVPFLSGVIVAWVFGHGGKWLCYFPPFIVRGIAYAQLALARPELPPGSSVMNLILWGFFVILCVESAAFGGVLGEVFVRRVYHRPESVKAAERYRPADRT